jgi:tetratricopeptide (TPR) repeat protein
MASVSSSKTESSIDVLLSELESKSDTDDSGSFPTGTKHYELASLYADAGDVTHAITHFGKALEIFMRHSILPRTPSNAPDDNSSNANGTSDSDSSDKNICCESIVRTCHRMSDICAVAGDAKKSLSLSKMALNTLQKTLGADTAHVDVADAYQHLANTYVQRDMFEEALTNFHACEAMHKSLGSDIVVQASIRMYIANVYMHQFDLEEGAAAFEKALGMVIQEHGEAHPEVGKMHFDFAKTYRKCGQEQDAVEHLIKATDVFEPLAEQDHGHAITFASVLNYMGTAYCADGELDAAVSFLERAESIQHKLDEHNESSALLQAQPGVVAGTLTGKGKVCMMQGKLDEALVLFQKALDYELKKGTDHMELADVYLDIAETYAAQQLIEESLSAYDKTIAVLDLHSSAHAREMLEMACIGMGDLLQKQNRLQDALVAFDKAYRIDMAMFGPNHLQTQHVEERMTLVTYLLGKQLKDENEEAKDAGAVANADETDKTDEEHHVDVAAAAADTATPGPNAANSTAASESADEADVAKAAISDTKTDEHEDHGS